MSTMTIHDSCIITSRLMPGIKIGDGIISIGYLHESGGRDVYNIWIDIGGRRPHHVTDLRSGVGGGTLQEGLESLLSFLGAAAESYAYGMRNKTKGENEDLFPKYVVEWAYMNSDEIAMYKLGLEEHSNLIEE